MKIKHPTSNPQHPTPNGAGRARLLDVGCSRRSQNGSVLIIVLWIAIGLVSIALYFANSMNYELRAADNRVSGLAAEQAIEGAARYVGYALQNFATNGAVPNNTQFKGAGVEVGDAKFWLIGRDPYADNPTEPYFGLVDEGGKLNLNNVSTNVFQYLPGMTVDFSDAILDWRGTNGVVSLNYASLGYAPKYAPFETVDELRLVYGADISQLAGEDINRNGILDKNEKDLNGNGELDPGLFEYVTVYTREPNFHADGSSLTNVNTATTNQFRALFQNAGIGNPANWANQLYNNIHPLRAPQPNTCNGILDFAERCKVRGLSTTDFANIYNDITTKTNTYLRNRVNVNTANVEVLTALFMGQNQDESTASSAAQTLVTYRQQNPDTLGSVAWVIDALGSTSPIITALARGDFITTKSYQFT